MSLFDAQPDVLPINTKDYELAANWVTKLGLKSYPGKLTIKAGDTTDLASIPSWLWSLSRLTPDGLQRGAAVAHDFLYGRRGIIRVDDPAGRYEEYVQGYWQPKEVRLTRAECDQVFLNLMLDAGVASWTAKLMYYSVRTFGWAYW